MKFGFSFQIESFSQLRRARNYKIQRFMAIFSFFQEDVPPQPNGNSPSFSIRPVRKEAFSPKSSGFLPNGGNDQK